MNCTKGTINKTECGQLDAAANILKILKAVHGDKADFAEAIRQIESAQKDYGPSKG